MKFTFKNKPIQRKYEFLRVMYEPTYRKYCKGHYKDDRRIYINSYRMYLKALLVLDTVYDKSVLIDLGAIHELESVLEDMKKIKDRFEQVQV